MSYRVVVIPGFFPDRRPRFAKELSHVLHPGLAERPPLQRQLLGNDPADRVGILQDGLDPLELHLFGPFPELLHELGSALSGRLPHKRDCREAALVVRADPFLAEASYSCDPLHKIKTNGNRIDLQSVTFSDC